MRRRVLVTGAAGNIGRRLCPHLAGQGFELVLLDLEPRGDPAVVRADLARYDEAWVRCLRGVDTVVHLAAQGNQASPWAALEGPNIDATINVYEAAVAEGCRRVVFASSNAAAAGYRGLGIPITPALPAWPVNAYGMTKVVGERLGRSHAVRHGLSVICLRIGAVRSGDNRPDGWSDPWLQQMWLSTGDLCQVVERAILVEGVGFAVLNAMSANPGMAWDLEDTRRVLGFQPRDGWRAIPPSLWWRLRTRGGRLWRLLREAAGSPRAPR